MATGFGDDEHYQRMSKAIAGRPAKPGLERSMLDVGDVVTFSRNKITGDRSYTNSVWEVIAVNPAQAMLKVVGGESRTWAGDKPIMLMLDEYEFYDGRPFLGIGE